MCEKAILHLGGGGGVAYCKGFMRILKIKIIPCQVTSNVLGSTVYIEK